MSGFAIIALVGIFIGFLFLEGDPKTFYYVGFVAALGIGGYVMFKSRS